MNPVLRTLAVVAALVVVVLAGTAAVVATIDKRALLGPLVAQLEQATGRKATIGAEPRIDLSLTPTLVLENVALANAPWGSAPTMLAVRRVEAQVALVPLLSRRIDLVRFTLVEPKLLLETDREGRPNWVFGTGGAPAQAAPAAAGAFALGEVTVERGEVTYRDGRTGATTPVRIERLYVRGRDAQTPLVAQFKGTVGDVPMDVEGAFGPLAALREGRWPWPVSVKGEVAGRAMDVQAKLALAPGASVAEDVVLSVGSTTLRGRIASHERPGARPLLRFEIAAEALSPRDLALAAAAAPPARPAGAERRLIPSTPIAFDGLRGVDAQGSVRIAALLLPDGARVGPVAAKVALDGGRLALDDLAVGAWGGTVRGRVTVDAREPAAVIALRLDARQLDGAGLLAAAGLKRSVQGAKTDVALDVAMRGDSVRALAASLDGTVSLRVGPASIGASDQGLAPELVRLLDALNPLRRGKAATDLRCAVARLPFRDGVARFDRGIGLETDAVGVLSSGSVDLRQETLDLSFRPSPRRGGTLDAATLAGAVRLHGPLASPSATLDVGGAVAAAAGLGALAKGGTAAAVALIAGRPGAGGAGGDECAIASGARKPAAEPAQPAQRGDDPRDVGQTLRRLFR